MHAVLMLEKSYNSVPIYNKLAHLTTITLMFYVFFISVLTTSLYTDTPGGTKYNYDIQWITLIEYVWISYANTSVNLPPLKPIHVVPSSSSTHNKDCCQNYARNTLSE